MRVDRTLACRLVFFVAFAVGSQAADFLQALSDLPGCGTDCFTSSIISSPCGSMDATCLCSDNTFYERAQECLLENCPAKEALEVARIEAEACKRPKRSRRSDFLIPLIVEIPAWICPWLRLYSKWTTGNQFAVEDWLMLMCGALYTGFTVIGHYIGMLAFGVDTWTVATERVSQGLKLFYVDESLYLLCLCLTKVSILFFYLRIFPNQRFQHAAYSTMAFVAISTVVFITMQIFQCAPIRYVWEGWLEPSQKHHCLDINRLAYSAASFSIAQDLVILVLPLPLLFKLNMDSRSKAGIIFMFSLGIFILVTSCVRLRYIIFFGHTANPSWDFSDPLIWSGLEVAVSIIVACLPAIRVLINRVVPSLVTFLVSRVRKSGYVKEASGSASSGMGHIRSKRPSARRSIFSLSKNREVSESEIELGLHLGDKMRGDVHTEICGPQRNHEQRDSDGIRINTITTTRVYVND